MKALPFLPFLLCAIALTAYGQGPCPSPPASLNPTAPDIFNAQQEQDLGDAYAETLEARARFLDDPAAELYLEKLGQKLLAVLPPAQLHFRYKIIDTEEINAYSTAGGRIYVTRKLIAAAKSEDELAGVLAHEMGHILTHQLAIEATAEMAQLLHVFSVGDRDDIFDKVHRMFEMEINGKWHASSEASGEDQADAVALYAVMKAGYVPHSYTDFWNRAANTGGKTGSAFGDFFHTTRPEQKRLRTMLAVSTAIPPGCAASEVKMPAEFLAWQQEVIAASVREAQTGTESKLIQLAPPLRSGLARVQFSPDGKYFFAQEESTIFVLARSTLEILFHIDATDADPAWFTPDSTHIVFSTASLRVEEWDIAARQRSAIHELVIYQQCLQHLLSPDGHTMACILDTPKETRLGLMLVDVPTGATMLKKDDAFIPTYNPIDQEAIYLERFSGEPMVSWSYTPDSKKLLLNLGAWTYLYDIDAHAMIKPSGAIGKLSRGPFAFVGNDRIVINNWDNPKNSGIYSFPDGKQLKRLVMGDQALEQVTRGDYLLLRPVKDSPVGVLDLNTDQIPITLKNEAVDIYDKTLLTETGGGGVVLTSEGLVEGAKDSTTRDLPVSLLGSLRAAAISADGMYLAVSSPTRSAFWKLDTGQRVLYIRPFHHGYFDENDRFYGDFSKYQALDRALVAIDVASGKAVKLPYDPDKNAASIGDLMVQFKARGDKLDIIRKYDLEVRDWKTNAVLWTRPFQHATPESNTMLHGNEMVLTWAVDSDGAREEMKEHPELKAEADALSRKGQGFLVEVLDKRTGVYQHGLVAGVGNWRGGGVGDREAYVFGDFALISSEHQSTAVYRLSTGQRLGEVFGEAVGQDAGLGLFCITNRRNELVIYDAATARERRHFTYATHVLFAQFLPQRKQLIVLTADQKVHFINLDDLKPTTAVTAQSASAAQ